MGTTMPTSLSDLEALYSDLESQGVQWHRETRRIEKELLAGVKTKLAQREQERVRFVSYKGQVFHALRAAKAAAEQQAIASHEADSQAEAAKIAAEGLADGSDPFAGVSNDVIKSLLETNEKQILALTDVKPPESRAEAVALLIRAGIAPPKPATEPVDAVVEPAAESSEPPAPAAPPTAIDAAIEASVPAPTDHGKGRNRRR